MHATASSFARIAALSALLFAAAVFGAHAHQAPGPATDRVGLPKYDQGFVQLRRFYGAQQVRVGTVFANAPAASVADAAGLPYPYGSVIIVEWRHALTDAAGAPLRDADGQVRAAEIVQIDVMRRERGFGEAYGPARTGEWEYASYRPDGSHATAPEGTGQCAACHRSAGAARDFVFRGRFPPADNGRTMGN